MANYVIGDIQGCFDEYSLLLNKIKFDSKKDFIWLTGDLINRGPASLSVLKHVYDNRKAIKTVLGNHDLHFLAVYYGVRKPNKFDTLSDLFNSQHVDDLAKWLIKQPLVREIKIGKREFIMVHAGFPKSATKKLLTEVNRKIKKALKNNPKKLFVVEKDKDLVLGLSVFNSFFKECTSFCNSEYISFSTSYSSLVTKPLSAKYRSKRPFTAFSISPVAF